MAKLSKVSPEEGTVKKYEKGKALSKKQDADPTPKDQEEEPEVLSDGTERGTDEHRLIDPNSDFMMRWDILSIVLLVFVMFVTPFEVAYLTTSLDGLFVINRVIDFFFVSDMVVQFFLMYRDEEKGVLVKKQDQIIRRYMSGWFWIDLIAILPFDMVGVVAKSDDLTNLKVLIRDSHFSHSLLFTGPQDSTFASFIQVASNPACGPYVRPVGVIDRN